MLALQIDYCLTEKNDLLKMQSLEAYNVNSLLAPTELAANDHLLRSSANATKAQKGMKYPQLVSPRAVNAISDWLVSRLEQLGVESPQIYTRLLLSLLQSSVQVNDPIEFSNLEAFFASRKGGHNKRFHLPSDTETLKKLNAVQCLREIVSNEQETATIEQLVEELCEKLKDIERQNQSVNDEERFLIEADLNTQPLTPPLSNNQPQSQQQHQWPPSSGYQQQQQHPHNSNQRHHPHQHQQHHQQQQQIYNNSHIAAINQNDSRRHECSSTSTTADCLNDLDNDPKKRYFRAFPALSKEMEDSFRIWRRNAKSLTWPIVGRSINNVDNSNSNNNKSNNSSASSTISSSSNFVVTSVADKIVEKKFKCVGDNLVDKLGATGTAIDICGSNSVGGGGAIIGNSGVQQQQQQQQGSAAVAAAASVKKKSKRRRNQALCKGKTIQNIRKLSVTSTTTNSVGGNKYHHYTHHRNSTPAWDTDFKGCWEMGPDLIKEFLSRQKGNKKRNRSNSDSMDHEELNERKILTEMPLEDDKPIMKRYFDLSFCCDDDDEDEHDTQNQCSEEGVDYVDEDYDDDNTLASVAELVTDIVNPKRLYQREGHLQKTPSASSVAFNVLIENFDNDNSVDDLTADSVDHLDFQQFKAKFNSSVEALWKDSEPIQVANSNPSASLSQLGGGSTLDDTLKDNNNPLGISSVFYANTSLNALAPFKHDLWNFWSNYNQQQQPFEQLSKLSTTASSSSMITTRLDDSSASSGAGADIANSSDYFSMPSNLDVFDKSVGGVRRTNEAGASLDALTPSINVFLQNSIWSTSGDCVDAIGTSSAAPTTTAAIVVDTDDSFLFKVWHSNKKLSQLDVGHNNSGEKMPSFNAEIVCVNDLAKTKETSIVNTVNSGANLQFPPYQNLKWSEGINAGPPYNNNNTKASNAMDSLTTSTTSSGTAALMGDNTNFAPFKSAANITGATWEAPAYGLNTQPDLKSWCASNPTSLTEMYGNDECDSIVNQSPLDDEEEVDSQADVAIGPAVTLPNHCANTSGFVSYARIKQCGLIQPQTKPLPSSLSSSSNAARLPSDFFRSSEDENLLNSERTHFHPIEHFVDGHTFDISNALDTIEFERSESGLMRCDSKEYLEYPRKYIDIADDGHYLKGSPFEAKQDEILVIKFRVQRTGEIACQTEEEDFQLAAAKMSELPTTTTPSANSNLEMPTTMFSNAFAMNRQANNEAIMAAVTKAVAAAAKAAADNRLNAGHFTWLPPNSNTTLPTAVAAANLTNTSSDSANPLWLQDVSVCDEVDFSKINTLNPLSAISTCAGGDSLQLAQNWSMQEVERQCHQRRCIPEQHHQLETRPQFVVNSAVEMCANDENSLDSSLHTLWGMCAVCNSCEYGKSMPANRLLRDELQLEADEIMSDLRYMQDLYIGESDILTEIIKTESDILSEDEDEVRKSPQQMEKLLKNNNVTGEEELEQQQQDPMQVCVLQKVNKLIEDLLKPDQNTGGQQLLKKQGEEVYDAKDFKDQPIPNVWNNLERSKNLWQCDDQKQDNNIWQHNVISDSFNEQKFEKDSSSSLMKPMKLLKKVGQPFQEDSQQHMEKLNWEHENLAKIWQQSNNVPQPHITSSSSPPSLSSSNTQTDECLMQTTHHEDDVMIDDLITAENKEKEDFGVQQIMVQEKNLKNLQTSPSSTAAIAANTYKRVQQFLNTSAAKIKLAANRKRRHSASQNIYQHQNLQRNNSSSSNHNNNSNNNNNNDSLTDLNAYKQNLQDMMMTMEKPNYNNTAAAAMNMEEQQPTKQTIITCKYWTTSTNGTQSSMDSAAAAMMLLAAATNVHQDNNMITADHYDDEEDAMLEENPFGNTFSCLIDKNASILKHVTMMTRPLTR